MIIYHYNSDDKKCKRFSLLTLALILENSSNILISIKHADQSPKFLPR